MSDVEKIVQDNYLHRRAADAMQLQLEQEAALIKNAYFAQKHRRAARMLADASWVVVGVLLSLCVVWTLTGKPIGALVCAGFAFVFTALAQIYAEDAES